MEWTLSAGQSRVRIPVGAREFFFYKNVEIGSGACPAVYTVGTGVVLRGYRPGREPDHSSQSILEVHNGLSHTSALAVCRRVVERDNFTLLDGVKWSALHHGCFTSRKRGTRYPRSGGLVSGTGWTFGKGKNLVRVPGTEPRFVGC
jgi:hypothetical protein